MALQMFVNDEGLERIPVLLASGVLDLAEVARFVGTPYYLTKPYSLEAMQLLLDKALGERMPPLPRLAEARP
jgi:hypothetical protein